jgi:hypothetical protein
MYSTWSDGNVSTRQTIAKSQIAIVAAGCVNTDNKQLDYAELP